MYYITSQIVSGPRIFSYFIYSRYFNSSDIKRENIYEIYRAFIFINVLLSSGTSTRTVPYTYGVLILTALYIHMWAL